MKEFKKEGLIVSIYVLVTILDKIGFPFIGIVVLLALPITIGLIIYLGITSTLFKTDKVQVIFSIYYKMLFILALFFTQNDYPGKDIISAIALGSTLLYIIYALLSKKKKDLIIIAILYINLFSSFLLLVR